MIKGSIKNKSKFLAIITLVGILGGSKVVNAEEGEEIENINIMSISNIKDKEDNIDTNIIDNINKIKSENIENRLILSSIKNLYKDDYEYSEEEKSNMIAANIVNSEDDSLVFNPYIVKEINGINIGIIGIYRNIDTELSNEGQFIYKDEVEVINKYSEELKGQGINNIIVLSDIPAITDEYEQIIDMNEDVDIYDIYNDIDEEVDIIISESNLNNSSSKITLQRELGNIEVVRSNIDENYLIDMDIHINEENEIVLNEVAFVASEFNMEEDIQEPTKEENKNSNTDDSIDNNVEEVKEELEAEEELESKKENIQARVVGGTNQDNSNTNNTNNNASEPDEDDKAEKEDEDKKDEDDKDKDDDKEESKKDDDKEDTDKTKSGVESTNNKSINPKTGDASIAGYIVASITSIVGLGLNMKYKKK